MRQGVGRTSSRRRLAVAGLLLVALAGVPASRGALADQADSHESRVIAARVAHVTVTRRADAGAAATAAPDPAPAEDVNPANPFILPSTATAIPGFNAPEATPAAAPRSR